MVEKFKKILEALRKEGDITLFAILKMDDLTNKWSVLFCTPSIKDEEGKKDTFGYIRDLIKENMTDEEAASIARIVVASKEEHLVQELLEYKTGTHIGDEGPVKVNGNVVYDGYILESNK